MEKKDNSLYTTSMDKALKYLDENTLTLYYITGIHCSCGNAYAKKITFRNKLNQKQLIYVCVCSQYALQSKQI